MATPFTNITVSNTATIDSIDATTIQASSINSDSFNCSDFIVTNLETQNIIPIGSALNIQGQTINIGTASTTTINMLGQVNYIQSEQLQVKDNLITLNKDGTISSALNGGIEVEASSSIIASIKLDSNLDWIIDSTNDKLTTGNINVTNTTTTNNLITNGNLTLKGNGIYGDNSLDNHTFNGPVTLSNSLSMNDDINMNSHDIISANNISCTSLSSGTATLSGNMQVNGNVIIGDASTDSHQINGILKINNNILDMNNNNITNANNITSTSLNSGTINTTGNISTTADISCVNLTSTGNTTISGGLTVDTQTLKLDNTLNRVGINTAAPAATLDINGTQYSRSDFYQGGVNHWYYDFATSKGKSLRNISGNDASGTEFSGTMLDRAGAYLFQQRGNNTGAYRTFGQFGWNASTAGYTSGNYNMIASFSPSNASNALPYPFGFGMPYSTDGTTNTTFTETLLFLQQRGSSATSCNMTLHQNNGLQLTHNNESASSTANITVTGLTNTALKVNGSEYISRALQVNENITTNIGNVVLQNGDININTSGKGLIFDSSSNNKMYVTTGQGLAIDTTGFKIWNSAHTANNFTCAAPNAGLTSYLYIDSGGRVGVACNPSSLYNLDVIGNSRFTGDMVLQGTINITNDMAIGANASVVGNLTVTSGNINCGNINATGPITCSSASYIDLNSTQRYRRNGRRQTMVVARPVSTTLTANTYPTWNVTTGNGYTYPPNNDPVFNNVYLQADKATWEFVTPGTYKVEININEAATANIQRTFQLLTSANGTTYTLHQEKRSVFIYNAFNPSYFTHQFHFLIDTEALGIYYMLLYYTGGTGNITVTDYRSSIHVYQVS